MTAPSLTAEQAAALDVARALAAAGVPVFVAPPDPSSKAGFKLPRNWQRTAADPAVVDAWQPGMALAAVCGHGLDVIDIDPRNGGDPAALNGQTPTSYGVAFTPSGGAHSFVKSLGVAKKTNLLPGIDVQAGAPDGTGRGFVFLAPTVRASKVTGQPAAYRWAVPLDLDRWREQGPADASGLALAELVRAGAQRPADAPSADEFMRTGPWANIEATLAQGRNNGVAKLAAALRGRGGWRVEDATRYMYAEVWPLVDQAQGGHPFTADEFEATIAAAWRQYPDGAEQRAAEAATPPHVDELGAVQPPAAGRYFGEKNTFLAATLAGDVAALGPLARGIDGLPWAYRGGVWRPDPDAILNRCAFLLGERYRPGHTANVEHILRGRLPEIGSEPVERLVNIRNGLLDWRTGELHPHAPEVLATVQLPVDWDPDAQCPAFDEFLAQVVAPDVVDTMWELVGYLMYSGNPLHKAVMLTGTGRNGKGTFLRVMVALLGRPNVTAVSLHDLVNTRFTTASLFGKLANIAGDIDGGYLENTAVLKGITGGDVISAEHKGRPRFDFSPWAVPVFSANRIPSSADTTVGYLSRWLVVNFPNDFTGRENRRLDQILTAPGELAGIAARGITALPRLLDRGDFAETTSARAARDEFARRVDQVRTWLFDCADLNPDHPWIARTELYQGYQRWATRDGHRPVKAAEFYDRLEAAGAVPAILHGTRGFRGIKIIDGGFTSPMGAAGAPLPTSDCKITNPQTESAPHGAGTAQGAGTGPAQDQQEAEGAGSAETHNPTNTRIPAGQGAGVQETLNPHVCARTREREWDSTCTPAPNRVSNLPVAPQLGESEVSGRTRAAHKLAKLGGTPQDRQKTKAKSTVSAERAEAKAEATRAKLDAAVAESAGELLELPALVTRDGAPRPTDLAGVAELAAGLGWADELTVDVETTGYPVGHADYALRTIQLGNEHAAVVLDAGDAAQLELAGRLLAAAEILHAHSATADLIPLAVAGVIDLDAAWGLMHDTVIPAKLADPASTGSDPGLKRLAGTVLGETAVSPQADAARAALFKAGKWLTEVKATTPVERSGWAQVDPRCSTMIRYAAADVLDDAALARRLPPVPPEVLDRERTVQAMTARVAYRGLRLDGGHVAELFEREQAALAHAAVRLRAFGVEQPGSDRQVADAAAQLGAALPRTATGRLSVAASALDPYKAAEGPLGSFVRARLDYQRAETALGLFLEPYRQLVDRGDGRARPTVYTLSADTGRMSCVRPNLQQVPREGGYRACVTADPGQLLVSADFAGVELRVAAALSGDSNLRRLIADEDAGRGDGVHWAIARLAFGPDATKADRYAVKRGVFGRIYGGGIGAIARGVGVSESVAGAIVAALDTMLPELSAWSAAMREAVKAGQTQFPTYAGRVIHLDAANPHKAPNYCIQGTARELLVDALMRWRETRWGRCTLLPVHDELLVMVPEDEAAEATAALTAAMQTELYGVAIEAEASEPSFEWSDAV